MIDAKTVEELRALLAKATPGPWEVDYLDKNGQRVIRISRRSLMMGFIERRF